MHFSFIPSKSVYSNLLTIKGIGPNTAKRILISLGISKQTKFHSLLPSIVDQLFSTLSYIRNLSIPQNKFSPIEFNLDKYNNSLVQDLISLKSYKSFRLVNGLPVNGQRTRSNAKTARKFKFRS